mgnify:CR=1 FL=1
MVIYLASLQMISREPIEAAIVDGCNKLRLIKSIILPLIKPTVSACLFLSVTEILNMFPLLMTLTSGGPGHATENISLYIYNEAFKSHNMGYACALSVILTIIVLIVAIGLNTISKED